MQFFDGIATSDGSSIIKNPFQSNKFLHFHVEEQRVTLIGNDLRGRYKWMSGVRVDNDSVLAIPCHSPKVLLIGPDPQVSSSIT